MIHSATRLPPTSSPPAPVALADVTAPETDVTPNDLPTTATKSFREAVCDFEVRLIQQALEATRHHQRKAADRLGLTYHQFRGLYRKHRESLEQD